MSNQPSEVDKSECIDLDRFLTTKFKSEISLALNERSVPRMPTEFEDLWRHGATSYFESRASRVECLPAINNLPNQLPISSQS